MPARDSIHEVVKEAIIKDGWEITEFLEDLLKRLRLCLSRVSKEAE
jgi:hypothetical protein